MKKAYIFLAEGFEDIEAITPIDLLRRGGMDVTTVSITSALQVRSANGVTVNADVMFTDNDFSDADWLICPGGMPGATNLYEFKPLGDLLARQGAKPDGRIAAICAAPGVVLGQLGLLAGEKATCYPGFEKLCKDAVMVDSPVVVSGKFVTGNGPANAFPWALTILKEAMGQGAANAVAEGTLYI